MTKITATVDEQGRLTLPDQVAQQLVAGQTVVIELDVPPAPAVDDNPFLAFVGLLPRLPEDSAAHYRRERGHDE